MASTMAFNLGLLSGSIDPLTGATERMASATASAPNARGTIQALAAVSGASSATLPDPAGTTQACAIARHESPSQPSPQSVAAGGGLPLFRAMFSDRRGAPVTLVVERLWAAGQAAYVSENEAKAAAARGQLNSLNLFVDHPRDPRALFSNSKS